MIRGQEYLPVVAQDHLRSPDLRMIIIEQGAFQIEATDTYSDEIRAAANSAIHRFSSR